jgi:hypothetical protein
MNDPVDDFNNRITSGKASWMKGPSTNAAHSVAQSFLDARQENSPPAGGGSIDFGTPISSVILLTGIAFYAFGAYALDNMQQGNAILAVLALIISGFMILIGGAGIVIASFKELGTGRGWFKLAAAIIAGLATWWFYPWLAYTVYRLCGTALLPPNLEVAGGLAVMALVLMVATWRR